MYFEYFDKDRNGYLTRNEVMAAMRYIDMPLDTSHVDALFAEYDRNKDARISFKVLVYICTYI